MSKSILFELCVIIIELYIMRRVKIYKIIIEMCHKTYIHFDMDKV